MIRAALPEEAESISRLALRSKAHWGYTAEQLAVFRAELTLASSELSARRAHVAEQSGRIVGFYTLASAADGCVELEHLFIEPSQIGRGIGARLFAHACECARQSGFETMVIQSDPNAAGFYRALGATLEREIPSSIPGRSIPYFTFSL